ncbi:MAG: hypothetical protein QXW94_01870 [Desulfurococcaceae archaeon]
MESNIISSIKAKASSTAPGLLAMLNLHCMLRGGVSVFDALLSNPELIVQALSMIYQNKETVAFIAREIFVKPVAQALGIDENIYSLVELFMHQPAEFKKKVFGK